MSAFDKLSSLLREKHLYSTTASTLDWDQETFLPTGGIAHRADQLSLLSGKIHELGTNDDYRKALEAAEDEALPEQAANLRELRHHFDRATKLPQELVEKDSQISSHAKAAWGKARSEDDFASFAPHLEALVALAQEKAELWGYADEPYTALLSGYERGANATEVVTVFDELKTDLAAIAAAAVEQSDVRLTTRYDENDFASSLFGVLHEAGHGLYEQGLSATEAHLPSGESVSLGIHESQSRLWENHVGRSRPFWEKWLPRAQELFPHLRSLDLDAFLRGVNRANYSFIRVEADEATYDLHILLRFSIERQLLNGYLSVRDVPSAWNELFKEFFGMTPPTNTEGCLQDIHWSMGGIGYFPTYSLGNLNAAQLFKSAMKDETISQAFATANTAPLLKWLQENVHSKGATLLPQQLMQSATGRPTDGTDYLAHLRARASA